MNTHESNLSVGKKSTIDNKICEEEEEEKQMN